MSTAQSLKMIYYMFTLLLPALVLGECVPHPEPANGVLVDSVWVPEAKAIRCAYGYVPVGSGIATCEDDEWSETLECDVAVALLVAGEEEDGYTDRVEIVSSSGSCMEVPPLPHPVHGAAGGWVGGHAVVCGGEPEPFAMSSLCYAFSPGSGTWLEAPRLKIPRSMSSAAVIDGALLLTGGYNEEFYSTALTELWIPAIAGLDTPWVESDPLPKNRADHCSVVVGDRAGLSVVVTGNYPETNQVNMAETNKLTLEEDGSMAWSSLPDMLADRDDHGCCLISTGGKVEVMVAGGPDTGSAEIFDLVTVSWRSAASMEHTVYGGSMAVVEGIPTVMGGYELEAHPRNQDRIQQYNPEQDSWTILDKKLSAGRAHAVAIPVPKSVFKCA